MKPISKSTIMMLLFSGELKISSDYRDYDSEDDSISGLLEEFLVEDFEIYFAKSKNNELFICYFINEDVVAVKIDKSLFNDDDSTYSSLEELKRELEFISELEGIKMIDKMESDLK